MRVATLLIAVVALYYSTTALPIPASQERRLTPKEDCVFLTSGSSLGCASPI
ncbi:hypothetical protein FRB95_010821 [Tulasnella sp. JGI-2019a]|nr:hypothetical protein FRB95_010821 [Tulasnella sp. JGI-2019a]